jgi:hypothetical protein
VFGQAIIMPKKEQVTTAVCYHCGADCFGVGFVYNDYSFCCSSCKTVCELLNAVILLPLSSVTIVLFGSLTSNILAKKYF